MGWQHVVPDFAVQVLQVNECPLQLTLAQNGKWQQHPSNVPLPSAELFEGVNSLERIGSNDQGSSKPFGLRSSSNADDSPQQMSESSLGAPLPRSNSVGTASGLDTSISAHQSAVQQMLTAAVATAAGSAGDGISPGATLPTANSNLAPGLSSADVQAHDLPGASEAETAATGAIHAAEDVESASYAEATVSNARVEASDVRCLAMLCSEYELMNELSLPVTMDDEVTEVCRDNSSSGVSNSGGAAASHIGSSDDAVQRLAPQQSMVPAALSKEYLEDLVFEDDRSLDTPVPNSDPIPALRVTPSLVSATAHAVAHAQDALAWLRENLDAFPLIRDGGLL